MTMNAPAQPSSIATNVSPPPPLTATTGADDLPDVDLVDACQTLPLVPRDLPVSPAQIHMGE